MTTRLNLSAERRVFFFFAMLLVPSLRPAGVSLRRELGHHMILHCIDKKCHVFYSASKLDRSYFASVLGFPSPPLPFAFGVHFLELLFQWLVGLALVLSILSCASCRDRKKGVRPAWTNATTTPTLC